MFDLNAMIEVGQIVAAQLTVFLVLLLGLAAIHKALQRSRTQRATADMTGLGWRSAGVAATSAALAEAAAAGMLLNPATRTAGALLAAALWSLYAALIGRAVLAGRRDLDCGCSFGAAHRPLGRLQLLRSLLLALVAGLVAVWTSSHVVVGHAGAGAIGFTSSALGATQLLAGVALLALYGAVDQVMAVGSMRAGEVR